LRLAPWKNHSACRISVFNWSTLRSSTSATLFAPPCFLPIRIPFCSATSPPAPHPWAH